MKIAISVLVCVKAAQSRTIFTHFILGIFFIAATSSTHAQSTYTLKPVGQSPLPLSVQISDIDASLNGIAFAATDAGLAIFDVTDSSWAHRLALGPSPASQITCVAVEGGSAYVGTATNGAYALRFVDITDPANPIWRTNQQVLPFLPQKIIVHQARVFISGGGPVAYINAKGIIFQTNTFPVSGATAFASPNLGTAYIAVSNSLQIWHDIAKRSAASIPIADPILDMCAINTNLYAITTSSNKSGALLVFDISTSTNAVLKARISLDGEPIRVTGTTSNAFVLSASGKIRMYAMNAAATWSNVASVTVDPLDTYYFQQVRLTMRGQRLYYSVPCRGVQIFEIQTTPALQRVGQFDTQAVPESMALSGKYAYLAAQGAGLLVYDVSDPANAVLVGQTSTPGRAVDIAINGARAYVACDFGGMQIFDLSNPASLEPLGRFETSDSATDVDVLGSTVLLAAGASGLQIIDTTDPLTPIAISTLSSSRQTDSARCVAVSGGFAIVGFSNEVTLADIHDPAHPVILKTLSGGASWITATNQVAFAGGSRRIDFQNPNEVTEYRSMFYEASFKGTWADYYLFSVSDLKLTIHDAWNFDSIVATLSGLYISSIAADQKRLYTTDQHGFTIYETTPPSRVRVVQPRAYASVRAGQPLRIEWTVENSTNQLWEITYQSDRFFARLSGIPQHDSYNNWWFDTFLPSDALTTTSGFINVEEPGKNLLGGISVRVEGIPNIAIGLSDFTAQITWPVVLDTYELVTKTNLSAAWTLIDTNTPNLIPGEFRPGATSTSEPARYFQLRRVRN